MGITSKKPQLAAARKLVSEEIAAGALFMFGENYHIGMTFLVQRLRILRMVHRESFFIRPSHLPHLLHSVPTAVPAT